MNKFRAFIVMLVYGFVSYLYSSPFINLTGRIISVDSVVVAGASVKLAAAGIETVSDSTGAFHLFANSIGHPTNSTGFAPIPARYNGSVVSFGISEDATDVTIEVFNALGRRFAVVLNKKLTKGNYSINPFTAASASFSNGFYILRMRIGKETHFFKMMGVRSQMSSGGRNAAAGPALRKIAVDEVTDTLVVSCAGYHSTMYPVDSYDKTLGNIMLISLQNVINGGNLGNSSLLILSQDALDTSVEPFKLDSSINIIHNMFPSDSMIRRPITLNIEDAAANGREYVLKFPINGLGSPPFTELNTFIVVQEDSLMFVQHGYICGDTLVVRVYGLYSEMTIAVVYNPNIRLVTTSDSALADSSIYQSGLNKLRQEKAAATWPTYRFGCIYDVSDAILKAVVGLTDDRAIDNYLQSIISDYATSVAKHYDWILDVRAPQLSIFRRWGLPEYRIILSSTTGTYYGSGEGSYAHKFGIFINYEFITTPATQIRGVIAHELFHGVVKSYSLGVDDGGRTWCAAKGTNEGLATTVGATIATGKLKPLVRTLSSNEIFNLDTMLLNPDISNRYANQDFFAYVGSMNGSLQFLSPLLDELSQWTSSYYFTECSSNGSMCCNNCDFTVPWCLVENYLKAIYRRLDVYFVKQNLNGLWSVYTGFILNRAYQHADFSNLRSGDEKYTRFTLRSDLFSTGNPPQLIEKADTTPIAFASIPSFSSRAVQIRYKFDTSTTPMVVITSESVPIQPDSLVVYMFREDDYSPPVGSLAGKSLLADVADKHSVYVNIPQNQSAEGVFNVTILIMNCAFRSAVNVIVKVTNEPAFDVVVNPAPPSGPVPLVVSFTPQLKTGSSPIESWTWDFGDGCSSVIEKPSHMYVKRGVYTVVVKGDGPGGSHTNQYTNGITVDPYTIVPTLTTRKSLECTGNVCNTPIDANRTKCIMLDYETLNGNTDGTYEFKLGGEDSSCVSACSLFISVDKTTWEPLWGTHTGLTANSWTTYYGNIYNEDRSFRYLAAYAPDCGMERFDYNVHQKPDACFAVSIENLRINEKVGFDGSCSQQIDIGQPDLTKIVKYLWDFGDGCIAEGQTVEHSYQSDGTFNVTLSAIDGQNGVDIAGKTITVTK